MSNAEYATTVKKGILNSTDVIKNNYLRVFNKDEYYSNVNYVTIDNNKYEEMIIVEIDEPKKDSHVSGGVPIKGWAIEKNATNSTGIDRIEFFLDGKPGDGRFLGKYSQNYEGEAETVKIIKNLYLHFYNRFPSNE